MTAGTIVVARARMVSRLVGAVTATPHHSRFGFTIQVRVGFFFPSWWGCYDVWVVVGVVVGRSAVCRRGGGGPVVARSVFAVPDHADSGGGGGKGTAPGTPVLIGGYV